MRGPTIRRRDGVRVRTLDDALPADAARRRRGRSRRFGCGLPEAYLARRWPRAPRPPVWIVLEYLSAEPWIDASHRAAVAASAAAADALVLVSRLHAAHRRPVARARPARARAMRSAPLSGTARRRSGAALGIAARRGCAARFALLLRQSGAARAARCVGRGRRAGRVPRPRGRGAAPSSTAGLAATCRTRARRCAAGALTLGVAPFVDQDGFDRRLWSCDLNFVRGEDSFVRAQWAAQPFVWHIYPQDADVHLAKMDAFLDRLEAGLAAHRAAAQRAFWYAWNAARTADARRRLAGLRRGDAGAARRMLRRGRTRWRAPRTWRRGWSSSAETGYNYRVSHRSVLQPNPTAAGIAAQPSTGSPYAARNRS